MKRYLLIFITCIFFAFPLCLSAAEVGKMNSCDEVGKNKCNNGKGSSKYKLPVNCNGTSSVAIKKCDDQETIPGKTECEDGPGKGFNIVILIDKSGSMSGTAAGMSKVRMTNDAVKKIIETYKNETSNSYVAAYTFCGNSEYIPLNRTKKSGFISVNDVTIWDNYITNSVKNTPNSLCDGTFTQSGLNFAYKLLKRSKSDKNKADKIPVIFLITDGYPTVVTDQTSVTSSGTISGKSLNPAPVSYFYYNLQTLKDLKQQADKEKMNLKLYTVGIIDGSDNVAKYLLNPTIENYNNLNSKGVNAGATVTGDENLSYAAYLKNFITTPGTYYDTVTSMGGNPDYGQSIGKVDVKNKTITYTISQSWYKNLRKKGKMCFSFSSLSKGNIEYIRINDGKKITSLGKNRFCEAKFCYFYYDIGNSFKNGKVKVEIKVKDGINSKYIHNTSSDSKYSDKYNDFAENNPVTNSVVGEKYTDIIKFISDSISDSMKPVCTPTKSKDVPITLYSGVCKDIDITSLGNGNFYYQINNLYGNDLTYANKNNKVTVDSIVKVKSVELPITVAGSAKFTFGNYDPIIYAGGGFKWTDTHVFNEYIWDYGLMSTGNVPMFKKVTFYVYLNGKDYALTNDVAITDICTDSSCKKHYTVDDLKNVVNNYLSSNSKLKNKTNDFKSNVFKSVNSNDAYDANDEKVYHNVSILDNFKFVNNNVILNYDFTLYNACTRSDSTVTYRESNCNANELFGGNMRYVPIKYFKSTAPIKVQSNISSFSDISINVDDICTVDVKQIAYDIPNGGCETGNNCKLTPAFTYRSIDHKNPFPKGKIPENWQMYQKIDSNFTRIKDKSYVEKKENYSYNGTFNFTNSNNYTDWSSIDQNGNSKFVTENLDSKVSNLNYCGLGVFKESCNREL